MEPINISNLTGVQKRIAESIDDGNKILEGSEVSVFNEVNKILAECKDSPQGALERLSNFLENAPANIKACIGNLKELFVQILSSDSASKANEIGRISGTTTVKYKEGVVLDQNILNQAVNNRIKRYMKIHKLNRSALIDSAATFIQQGKEKGVDPFILIAIAMYESTYGTSKAAINSNNIGGLKVGGKVKYCESVPDSIAHSAGVLSDNLRLGTLQGVARKGNYVCGSAADRQKWCDDIVSIANGLRNEYNKLLGGAK